MEKISTCLWFEGNAEEAAKFYTSVFKNSKMGKITHYNGDSAKASGMQEGSVMTVTFELEGRNFMGLNGGPVFKFTEAISLMVSCDTQEEIDYYWEKLTSGGGEESMCGWLKDKYGLSWQIIPGDLADLMKDPARAQRVMAEVLKMKKLDINILRNA
jgi:predicted 3-demethylubiquinone-9 3-methyltransferase (glyoxalase superfamily)